MDGPVEVDTIQPCHLVELLNAVGLVGRVGLAPLVAVVGVVLRSVDVCVHLVATIEGNLAEAGLVAPRCAVETLYSSAEVNIWPVGNGARLKLALGY